MLNDATSIMLSALTRNTLLTDEQKETVKQFHAQMIYDILTVQPMTRGEYSSEEKVELANKLEEEYNITIDTRI